MAKAARTRPTVELHKKYRPKTLKDFKGNPIVKRTLQSHIKKNSLPHAILLSGPFGCGKTTLARILASQLNCSDFDLNEVDTADYTGIENIRDIRKHMHHRPMKGSSRVWILDECHKLSKPAMSAILKALEEPPEHVYFFLCTTDPEQLLPTIKSRCTNLHVNTLNENAMVSLLKEVIEKEKVKVPDDVLTQVAQDSLGHPRDALKILTSVIALESPKAMLKMAKTRAAEVNQTIELCRALTNSKSTKWTDIAKILSGLQEEPETIRYSILGYFNTVLKNGSPAIAVPVLENFKDPMFYSKHAGLSLAAYKAYVGIRKENS